MASKGLDDIHNGHGYPNKKIIYKNVPVATTNLTSFSKSFTLGFKPKYAVITDVIYYSGGADTNTFAVKSNMVNDTNGFMFIFNDSGNYSSQHVNHNVENINIDGNTFTFNVENLSTPGTGASGSYLVFTIEFSSDM